MATVLRLISALGIFVLSGFVVLKMADRRSEIDLGPSVKPAVAFMLGLGIVSLQMFIYSLVSVPYSFLSVMTPWVLIPAVALALPAGKARTHSKAPHPGFGDYRGWLEVSLLFLILLQVAYAFAYATIFPVRGWDAWSIWFFKAKVFFSDRGVSKGFLLNGSYAYSHQDYPLMIPLSAAWIYTAIDRVSEPAAKLIYPLQYASLLLIFHHAVKKVTNTRLSLVFTLMLSLTPIIMAHAAGLPWKLGPLYMGDFTGYSDLSLSIYFLGAGAFIYLYVAEGRTPHIYIGALFLATGAWAKNEGVAFALIGAFFIIINLLMEKRGKAFLPALASVAVILAFILPWAAYKSHYGISSEYTGNLRPSVIADNTGRLPEVLYQMGGYMFTHFELYNFTWWAYAASLVINWRGFLSRPLLFLNILVFAQFGAYALVYIITPADIDWQLSTSLDRLIIHMIPLAMMITAFNLSEFLYGSKTASRP